ncbi:MAG: TfoX/Sxy family protein [Actinomycetota bacterium]
MAYDEALAERVRDFTDGDPNIAEKKMFGGLGFLVNGNMAVAASGQGGLLVRVDPEESETLVTKTNAHPMVMRGREMNGWLIVDAADLKTKAQLARWVNRGLAYARSLDPK